MTGDSLQSELGLLSSTPELAASATAAARSQLSLRRVLLFNDDQ